jgi:hypothetical protein
MRLIVIKIGCVSLIEKERLAESPNLGIAPVFGENIGGVEIARDVVHRNKSGGNGFSNTMK